MRHGRRCLLRVCAVTRRRFPVGASPTRQPLRPEAIGAVMEVTKWLKPSISVSRIGGSASVQAATRVNAEQASKRTMRQADPTTLSGKADTAGWNERIVSQPTWGVDAGAAATIRQALIDLSARGAAVLVISPGSRRIGRDCRPHRGDVPRPAVGAAGSGRSDAREARIADGRREPRAAGGGARGKARSWCLNGVYRGRLAADCLCAHRRHASW